MNLNEYALVFGSGNKLSILAPEVGVVELPRRDSFVDFPKDIAAVHYYDGALFYALEHRIFNHTGEKVGERQSGPVVGIDSVDGALIGLSDIMAVSRHEKPERRPYSMQPAKKPESPPIARVYSVNTNEQIAAVGRKEGLIARTSCLALATNQNKIFVSNEFVVSVKTSDGSAEQVTERLGDYVFLVSDNEHAYALSSRSCGNGTELIRVDDGETVAYWDTETYGHLEMATMITNDDNRTLVFGTSITDYKQHDTKTYLYAVEVDTSKTDVEASPSILNLINPFESRPHCIRNTITAVPMAELENIVRTH